MEVLKFEVFTKEEFIQWQLKETRKIHMVSPILGGLSGTFSDTSAGMQTDVSVFVLFWEKV